MAKYRVYREPVVQPQDQSYRLLALTRGFVAKVDAEDYERAMALYWCARWHPRVKSYYALASHGGPLLHRFIMNAAPGQQVDHISGDTLDCRKSNLRFATPAQNAQNRKKHSNNKSGCAGVLWMKDRNKWRASICCERKSIYLGDFKTQEAAVAARRAAQVKFFGDFESHR